MDPNVWFQISGRYRTVAKLPDGMTGIAALQSEKIREPEWAEAMGEGHAGDYYLRCISTEKKELTRDEWYQYKKAGGTHYMGYCFQDCLSKAELLVQQMVRNGIIVPEKADSAVRIFLKELF